MTHGVHHHIQSMHQITKNPVEIKCIAFCWSSTLSAAGSAIHQFGSKSHWRCSHRIVCPAGASWIFIAAVKWTSIIRNAGRWRRRQCTNGKSSWIAHSRIIFRWQWPEKIAFSTALALYGIGLTQLEELDFDSNAFERHDFDVIEDFSRLRLINLCLIWNCNWLDDTVQRFENMNIGFNLYSSHSPTNINETHINFNPCVWWIQAAPWSTASSWLSLLSLLNNT